MHTEIKKSVFRALAGCLSADTSRRIFSALIVDPEKHAVYASNGKCAVRITFESELPVTGDKPYAVRSSMAALAVFTSGVKAIRLHPDTIEVLCNDDSVKRIDNDPADRSGDVAVFERLFDREYARRTGERALGFYNPHLMCRVMAVFERYDARAQPVVCSGTCPRLDPLLLTHTDEVGGVRIEALIATMHVAYSMPDPDDN